MAKPDIAQPEERLRQTEALNMRLLGATWDQIAKEKGYADPSGAYRAVEAVLKRVESAGASELRKLEDMRLDLALRKVGPGVMAGDLKAIELYAKLHDRRVKLHGLAMPEKLIVAQSAMSAEEFATRVDEDLRELGYVLEAPAPADDADSWANT
ncbi:hypothetical protein [Nocardia salmonicida]|uniref:hypothetical protein n=1 Tax=Nocardia salmonicida TaxID=53431 RepID=UPI0033E55B13